MIRRFVRKNKAINPFLAKRSPSAFATFAPFLFKNIFAYFCLEVFFYSDHEPMKVAVL